MDAPPNAHAGHDPEAITPVVPPIVLGAVTAIRWVLVAPVAIAAWFATLFAGLIADTFLGDQTPSSDAEYANWEPPEPIVPTETLMVIFAGVSAVAVVTAAVVIAPKHRTRVAAATWVAGAVSALAMLDVTEPVSIHATISALVAGALAAYGWHRVFAGRGGRRTVS